MYYCLLEDMKIYLCVNSQCVIHAGKQLLSLIKEFKNNRLTKIMHTITIEIQDRLEDGSVNAVLKLSQRSGDLSLEAVN